MLQTIVKPMARKYLFSVASKKVEIVSLTGPVEEREAMFAYCHENELKLRGHQLVPGSEGRMFRIVAEREIKPTVGIE